MYQDSHQELTNMQKRENTKVNYEGIKSNKCYKLFLSLYRIDELKEKIHLYSFEQIFCNQFYPKYKNPYDYSNTNILDVSFCIKQMSLLYHEDWISHEQRQIILDHFINYYFFVQLNLPSNNTFLPADKQADKQAAKEYFYGYINDESIHNMQLKLKGDSGEEETLYSLKWLNKERFLILNNDTSNFGSRIVLFNQEFTDEKQEIDHIVIGDNGIWLLETKHYSGHIEIDFAGNWKRYKENGPIGIQNPIQQIRRHEALMRSIIKDKTIDIHSVLVLSNPNVVIDGIENSKVKIIKSDMLEYYISNTESNREISEKQRYQLSKMIKEHEVEYSSSLSYEKFTYNKDKAEKILISIYNELINSYLVK